MSVPNILLRGIDEGVHEALRTRAAANGRSVNAEILAIVEGEVRDELERGQLHRELRKLRREIHLPPDAPPPEQIIREARDAR